MKQYKFRISLHLMIFIAGLILVMVGIYSILEPWQSFGYFVKYTGVTLFLSSTILLVYSFMSPGDIWEKGLMISEGLVDLCFATLLIFNPFLTVIIYPLIIGCWIFCRGILKIILAVYLSKRMSHWKSILTVAIISLVFGLIFMIYPYGRIREVGLRISIFAIVIGVLYVYDAVRLRKSEEELVSVV